LEKSKEVLQQARQLPSDELGKMMSVVSCLGSRPNRLLDSTQPSPGEVRKLLLASGIARVPHLIVMDEPTNHMDLPSIECLEQALSTCPCGILLVSHDERFLGQLSRTSWELSWVGEVGGDSSLAITEG
jgi:ATPase subunit of ABC transporter with duplicated ATPase domains